MTNTNIDTITNCPSHLETHLTAARARWAGRGIDDCRAHQAAEVLEHAAGLFNSRSWDAPASLEHALLGAWLANASHSEAAAQREQNALSAKVQAEKLGALSASEIALILAARARR